MDAERIWMLTAKKRNGEATVEELKELEDSLRSNPELHSTIELFYSMWGDQPVEQPDEGALKRLLERIKEKTR